MARRIRILIYDGPQEWLDRVRERDFVQMEFELGDGKRILSIEATPSDIMGGVLPGPYEPEIKEVGEDF
jgi:hypothetical protein